MFSFLTYGRPKSDPKPPPHSAQVSPHDTEAGARTSNAVSHAHVDGGAGTSAGCTCSDHDARSLAIRNPNSISDRHASSSGSAHATSAIATSKERNPKREARKRSKEKPKPKKTKPPSTNLLLKPLAVTEVSRQSVSFTGSPITPAMKSSSNDILLSASSPSSYRSINESRSSAISTSNDGQIQQGETGGSPSANESLTNHAEPSQETLAMASNQQHISDQKASFEREENRLPAKNDLPIASDQVSGKDDAKSVTSETEVSYGWFSWFRGGRASQPDEERIAEQPSGESTKVNDTENVPDPTVDSAIPPVMAPSVNDTCEPSPSSMESQTSDDKPTQDSAAPENTKESPCVQTSSSSTWQSWIFGSHFSQQRSQDGEATRTETETETNSEVKPALQTDAHQSPLQPRGNQKSNETPGDKQPTNHVGEETTVTEDTADREKQPSESVVPDTSSGAPYRWSFWSRFRSTTAVNDPPSDSPNPDASQMPASASATMMTENSRPSTSMSETTAGGEHCPSDGRPSSASASLKPVAKPQPEHGKEEKTSSDALKAKAVPSLPLNYVLPELHSTYEIHSHNSSLLQKIGHLGRYLVSPSKSLSSAIAMATDTPTPLAEERQHDHVALTSSPPRIRQAVAIGVHGYFPAGIVQTFLGPPTGTSVRFATMAARAIIDWNKRHGQKSRVVEMATGHQETEISDVTEDEWDELDEDESVCQITMIPLQGEGRISDRVETLYRLLLMHIETLKQADFIFVACHSQGVPVTTMLLDRLLNEFPGILQRSTLPSPTRIGICAMAGVSLGPFPDFQSRFPILGGTGSTLNQLFDFANPESVVSKDYTSALQSVLRAGVRVTYIGSLDDQLVPLESSVFTTVAHPYIYRAVFIDGRVHAPSFLSHLISFIMKLRNLGISDHGLIHELSPQVAGRLYRGDGHSRVYLEDAVYRTAVSFALESLSVEDSTGKNDPEALTLRTMANSLPTTPNPYYLPFIMRGILAEDYVKRKMSEDVKKLVALFKSWEPVTAGLRDMKFRLEGIRSNL